MQSEIDDGHQHQQRRQERVNKELDAGVDPSLATPDADYEVHRHQHHFPCHIEEEEIARHEYAEHAAGENQQQRVIAAHFSADARPASERRQWHDEGRQQNHHQRDSIDSGSSLPGRPGGTLVIAGLVLLVGITRRWPRSAVRR